MSEIESYASRIRKAVPEIKIEGITLNREGLMNDIVIVNGDVVFRFPKHEYSRKHLKNETRILRILRKYISLEIPSPLYEIDDAMAYRFIPGEALRRDMLVRLSEDDQQAIADQLAQFFKDLHSVPINEISDFEVPMADALMKYDGWVNAYQRIRDKVFPLLLPHARDWVEEHFETHLASKANFEYELKMVDTDVPPYHILFDGQEKRISGIIDFGCAGLGDPAIDFGVIIYHYGESFLRRFYIRYPEAETYLKRARFYAGAHEVRWLLAGSERSETFWFAVHIGSAKDVYSSA